MKKTKNKKLYAEIKSGSLVRVHHKVKEGDKERIQIFEGLVIARKHGSQPGATITVRRDKKGYGVEQIFPLHSPKIDKIELVKQGKVRRSKLYYMRKQTGKKAKLKSK